MSELVWRKSTRTAEYNCVEVAVTSEFAAVRDSKDRGGGHFAVSRSQWSSFLSALRGGWTRTDGRGSGIAEADRPG